MPPIATRPSIPVTVLRRFYDLLRAFPSEAFHRSAAAECVRRPEQLARLIVESQKHLSSYNNCQEAFHPRVGGLTPRRLQSTKLANVYLQRLERLARDAKESYRVEPFSFTYVDYEVGPLRTTRSICEDGRSGDVGGAGGIDVLLSDADDQTPVVGEIKADTDVNCFFALIQSLMCAVELSTPAQQERLSLMYPGQFAFVSGKPSVDIALIFLRYGDGDQSLEFLRLTKTLASLLMEEGNSASSIVRRIIAVNDPMDGDALQSSVVFAFGQGMCDGQLT